MNWLDKTIDWFSPSVGLRRARARATSQALLSYEGVRSERRQGGWTTTGTSGNAEIGPSIKKLRENARDLVRNNAYARRATREWAKRLVGTGITPRAKTGDEAYDTTVNALWAEWVTQCTSDHRLNFYAAQKLLAASRFASGEVLVRLWTRRLEDGLTVPLQIQILESDYLDTGKTETTRTGYIIQGVQFDQLGRIEGYWLFGQHPGEVTLTNYRGLTSKLVSADDVLHYAEIERPGDVRAVTQFAAVMNKLRDIDEYADAEIVRKKIEACMVGSITQAEGPDGPTVGPTATDANGNKVETFSPGQMIYGSVGSNVEFFSPTSSGDFSQHKKTELREVAVGTEVPYILLDDNMEAVNYSSFRGGLLAYKDSIEEHRWNWFIPQVLDPIWVRFIDTAVMAGELPRAEYGHQWDAPPFELLDRAAEAEGDRAELQIGKKTWPQMVGEWGNDPVKQLAEIKKWKADLEAAGVTFAKSTTDSGSGEAPKTGGPNGSDKTPPPKN